MIFFLSRGQVDCPGALRLSSVGEHAYAILVPDITQAGSWVDVNESHAMYRHTNEGLLRDALAGMRVML